MYIHAAFLWKLEATSRRLQTSSKFRQTCEVECFFVSSPLVVANWPPVFQTKNFKRLRISFRAGSKAKLFVAVWIRTLKKKACKFTSSFRFTLRSTHCRTWILWGVQIFMPNIHDYFVEFFYCKHVVCESPSHQHLVEACNRRLQPRIFLKKRRMRTCKWRI